MKNILPPGLGFWAGPERVKPLTKIHYLQLFLTTPQRCPKPTGGVDATQNPTSLGLSDPQREIPNHREQEY